MANRAYLFFCDDVTAIRNASHREKADGNERAHMDSRLHGYFRHCLSWPGESE